MSDNSLGGVRVLVTRPAGQAESFAAALAERGASSLIFPAVQIAALNPGAVREELQALARQPEPLFLFVSRPAVAHGLQTVTDIFGEAGILNTAAVGRQTAEQLRAAGCRNVIEPASGNGSEALLRALESTAMTDRCVIILRGPDGRELLARELSKRGAAVTQVSVYRRLRPTADPAPLAEALQEGAIDVVTVTSAGIFENLLALLDEPGCERLRATTLLVPSQRVVTMVRQQGAHGPVILARGADDASLLAALAKWHAGTTGDNADEEPEMSDDKRPEADGQESGALSGEANSSETSSATAATEDPALQAADKVVVEKKSGGVLAALALLIALAASAGTAWLWWQDRSGPDTASELDSARTGLQAEIRSLREEIAGLDDQFSDLLSDQQGNALKLRGIEDLNLRLQNLTGELESMRGVSTRAKRSWAIAEAAYFMQAANTSLQLGRNVDAAINALAAADDRLASTGDPALMPVREAVASELQALQALPDTDVTGIALTLGQLAERAGALPTQADNPQAYATPAGAAAAEDSSGLERARRVLGEAMKSMVTVRRTDQQATALLAPEEEFFLARNLELQLLTARLALLREEPELFNQSIATALVWLREFFDQEASEVASTITTLERLKDTAVRRRLPDISGSLTLLRNLQDAGQ